LKRIVAVANESRRPASSSFPVELDTAHSVVYRAFIRIDHALPARLNERSHVYQALPTPGVTSTNVTKSDERGSLPTTGAQ